MKNTYNSEEGACGLWISYMREGVPVTQEHEWEELCYEEAEHYGLIEK
jgi:hypothetical protein